MSLGINKVAKEKDDMILKRPPVLSVKFFGAIPKIKTMYFYFILIYIYVWLCL